MSSISCLVSLCRPMISSAMFDTTSSSLSSRSLMSLADSIARLHLRDRLAAYLPRTTVVSVGMVSSTRSPDGGHVSVIVVGPSMMMYAAQLRSVLPQPLHTKQSSVVPSMTPHHLRMWLDDATPTCNERQSKQANAHQR